MSTRIDLKPDVEERLVGLAKVTGRSKADLILQLIEQNLSELEDICLAEQRLKDLKAGQTRSIRAEDVWED
ncbi:RHH-type rel operon transcriptional repressor/antitoxin RelB [Alkalispirillum mobile]|uniref:RHH-type rel operon transcriptional repressor/antitoxin RelB n=1 Tax=Alkalispirillum mobile TaxID=85925 RepID=A0A498BZH7_9GAMM|nr:CopG family transcriptional regulator [Alkalispirillum mobile]RLK48363.1 RHH-type rel operon transcriptional repressor/antitoxin RelB [Alkalispirillum mobile]